MITTPTPTVALDPELLGEELDEPFRARVEQVAAGREEQLVEQLERGVEEQQPEHSANDGHHRDDDPGARQTAPQPAPGPRRRGPARNWTASTTAAPAASTKKRGEHAADVAHVAPLALVEDRRAVQGDVEVRWSDHQVREDRAGHRPAAGPA